MLAGTWSVSVERPQRGFRTGIVWLNALITSTMLIRAVTIVWTLPDYHRDPFDRMLVAQSQVTGLAVITDDPLIARYEVDRIW